MYISFDLIVGVHVERRNTDFFNYQNNGNLTVDRSDCNNVCVYSVYLCPVRVRTGRSVKFLPNQIKTLLSPSLK